MPSQSTKFTKANTTEEVTSRDRIELNPPPNKVVMIRPHILNCPTCRSYDPKGMEPSQGDNNVIKRT